MPTAPRSGPAPSSSSPTPTPAAPSAELLPRFDTITYGELSDRVNAITDALAGDPVRPGDRVALLGFTSVDYTIRRHRADRPRRGLGAAADQRARRAAAPDHRRDRAGRHRRRASTTSTTPWNSSSPASRRRGWSCSTTCRRSTTIATPLTPPSRGWPKQVSSRRRDPGRRRSRAEPNLPAVQPSIADDDDPLALLIYTSGSTGAPKGAMYPRSWSPTSWRRSVRRIWGDAGHPPVDHA